MASAPPTEILCQIFHLVRRDALDHDEAHMSWASLACVSKHWRNALYGDPSMWTNLFFRPHTPLLTIAVVLRRSGLLQGLQVTVDAGHGVRQDGWFRTLFRNLHYAQLPISESVTSLRIRWHVTVRAEAFDVVEALRADHVQALQLEEYAEPLSEARSLSWSEDVWGSDTDVDEEDEEDEDEEDEDEKRTEANGWDCGESDSPPDSASETSDESEVDSEDSVSQFAEDYADATQPGDTFVVDEDPESPRILKLPRLHSLEALDTSGILVDIPQQVKEKLVLLNLSSTVSYYEDFVLAGHPQSWLLDTLEGCTHLQRLSLDYTLPIEDDHPAFRPIVLPRLEYLFIEDRLEYMEELVPFFLHPFPTVEFRAVLGPGQVLYQAQSGIFSSNFPSGMGESITALDLRVDGQFTVKGWPGEDADHLEARQSSTGTFDTTGWTAIDRAALLPSAVEKLSRIVDSARIVHLSIHISPVRQYQDSCVYWQPHVIQAFPSIRRFALGSRWAVKAFIRDACKEAEPLARWTDLNELNFCLGEVSESVVQFIEPFWERVRLSKPDSRLVLRLHPDAERMACPDRLQSLKLLAQSPDSRKRLELVTDCCETCGTSEPFDDAVFCIDPRKLTLAPSY
ncbi:hypothetical protein BD311DRAFT_66998 [Dichomitus squalens]|uniref:F-box domain-containing protein n=1 Tax=Dichomitus squalens TaxID=114155 RepID=A0A4Q9MCB2_9APHY|nr:hypothetical protein BD311DRAFT_66998 [Dichomitus squalens]